MSNVQGLTSTTAPGKVFASRSELAEHYKSDWHKYNLKRREANMAMLTHDEFSARLEAAIALRKEREGLEARSGKDHLKDKSKSKSGKKKNNQSSSSGQRLSKRQLRQQERRGIPTPEAEEEYDDEIMEEDADMQQKIEEEEPPVIDPRQSLFDKHICPTVDDNIEYMYKKYGFFVPDVEFLVEKEGLIGYCAEKIKLGHTCLYCQRIFRTWRGCQEHMINTRHTKLRYEADIDLEEFDVFYDFSADDQEFLKSGIGNHHRKRGKKAVAELEHNDDDELVEVVSDDEDDGEWEDVDSDEEMEEEEEHGLYAAYQDEITRHGFDITPLGELIFPDGRIIGHRGLSKYYKQRLAPEDDRTAVVAAKRANGERLYQGRVYDTYAMSDDAVDADLGSKETALSLAKAGLSIGAVSGRQGKGILVPTGGGSRGTKSFTALSLYRYKAVVKKAQREEFKGRRLQQRTTLPMNKMDKKANRLYNNVSVAHAPR